MKKLLLLFIIFQSLLVSAQSVPSTKQPVQKVKISPLDKAWLDFAECASYNFRYGSDAFKGAVYLHMRRLQYSISDISVIMEMLPEESQHRKEVLKSILLFSSYNRETLFLNLHGLGMSAVNAKLLCSVDLSDD